jgi:CSLREA domain-containing protein
MVDLPTPVCQYSSFFPYLWFVKLKGDSMKNQVFRSIFKCVIVLTLLLPAWLAWDVSPARGAVLMVTTLDDPTPNGCTPDNCSLREAIIQANSAPDVDTILLIPGDYYTGQPGSDDNALVGDLDILYPLQLFGPGKEITTIYAFNGDRVFSIISAGQVSISGLTIYAAMQPNKDGGGIHCVSSTLNLDNVKITNFDAPGNAGGGIYSDDSTVTMSHVNITDNMSRFGGGLYAEFSTITINNSSIDNNLAVFDGGGIRAEISSLTIDQSVIDSNTALYFGGGIYTTNTSLSLSGSAITNNQANDRGGGIMFESPAISNTLSIGASLVANNISLGYAGGILAVTGTGLNITNSTISGNIAYTWGGGIFTYIPTSISHTTIVDNIADYDINNDGRGGGLMAYQSGALVTIANSILANNDDRSTNDFNDCDQTDGTVTSQGYNLVESPGPCTFSSTGDIVAQDPNLGPLQDNGGATQTHALLLGSLAIDAGNPMLTRAFVVIPLYDQRGEGFRRVVNGRIDIGAFEAWIWTFLPVLFR